jgi:hypothetical protein
MFNTCLADHEEEKGVNSNNRRIDIFQLYVKNFYDIVFITILSPEN